MADVKDALKSDLVVAMKARDEQAKSTIRMALAAIGTEEVAGTTARELDHAEEQAVLTREVNRRKDAAQAYTDGGRPELAAKELSEAEFLGRYLPAPLDDAELEQIVDAALAQFEADRGQKPTMRDMGAVMKAVQAEVAGRAQGGTVSTLVKQRLQA